MEGISVIWPLTQPSRTFYRLYPLFSPLFSLTRHPRSHSRRCRKMSIIPSDSHGRPNPFAEFDRPSRQIMDHFFSHDPFFPDHSFFSWASPFRTAGSGAGGRGRVRHRDHAQARIGAGAGEEAARCEGGRDRREELAPHHKDHHFISVICIKWLRLLLYFLNEMHVLSVG